MPEASGSEPIPECPVDLSISAENFSSAGSLNEAPELSVGLSSSVSPAVLVKDENGQLKSLMVEGERYYLAKVTNESKKTTYSLVPFSSCASVQLLADGDQK